MQRAKPKVAEEVSLEELRRQVEVGVRYFWHRRNMEVPAYNGDFIFKKKESGENE